MSTPHETVSRSGALGTLLPSCAWSPFVLQQIMQRASVVQKEPERNQRRTSRHRTNGGFSHMQPPVTSLGQEKGWKGFKDGRRLKVVSIVFG